MTRALFRCPIIGVQVQQYLGDRSGAPDDAYEAVTCPACRRLHFFNVRTGRLLGEKASRGE